MQRGNLNGNYYSYFQSEFTSPALQLTGGEMDRWTTANRWRKGQLDHRRGQQVDEHLEKEKNGETYAKLGRKQVGEKK